MQEEQQMRELFARSRDIDVRYTMPLPPGLRKDYWSMLDGCDLANL